MKKNILKNIIKINEISNKEKLALGITLLILISFIMFVFSDIESKNETKIDYNNFRIEEEINEYLIIKDAQKYYDLYEIISDYLTAYSVEMRSSDKNIDYSKAKYTREEYYNVLSEDYKKRLNKKEYMEVSRNFCRKFIYASSYGETIDTSIKIIGNIYLLPSKNYGKNMYVCSLNTSIEGTRAYIGIHLNESLKTYDIFYIE